MKKLPFHPQNNIIKINGKSKLTHEQTLELEIDTSLGELETPKEPRRKPL